MRIFKRLSHHEKHIVKLIYVYVSYINKYISFSIMMYKSNDGSISPFFARILQKRPWAGQAAVVPGNENGRGRRAAQWYY